MPTDASRFNYAPIYHRLIDPPLKRDHQVVVDLIPEGSSVLDIACGTGAFAIMLRSQKNCRVEGIDLSRRMVEFARKMNPYPEVTFIQKDGTNLVGYVDGSFDCATALILMHELWRPQQLAVLNEALRLARKVIIYDAVCPLPNSFGGFLIRAVEATFGSDHNAQFHAFLSGGGIEGIIKEITLPVSIEKRLFVKRSAREAVVLTKMPSQ